MKLPDDIRLKIEKSADKEDILLLLARLEIMSPRSAWSKVFHVRKASNRRSTN